MNRYDHVQELLQDRAELQARLKLLPYDGSPEIKEISNRKYLYVRKRVGSRLTSTYVGEYSDELHALLLRNQREARELRKELRRIEKALSELGFEEAKLPAEVLRNLEFARANMKKAIYEQAVLEGVSTTFPQTEDILEGGKVHGLTAQDVQKVLNLTHAWEFILDPDVLAFPSGLDILQHIAKLVNEGFFADGGRIRGVPVSIGGTSYSPPLPFENQVRETLADLLAADEDAELIAIRLCLYCMKAQIFNDGNKRAAILFANHYLISRGAGLLIVPEDDVPAFRELLVAWYEGRREEEMIEFMKTKAFRPLE